MTIEQLIRRNYQKTYWLKKAKKYGITIDGKEDEAAREAEAKYKKEYRKRIATAHSQAD